LVKKGRIFKKISRNKILFQQIMNERKENMSIWGAERATRGYKRQIP
jgi:hypothetical protein